MECPMRQTPSVHKLSGITLIAGAPWLDRVYLTNMLIPNVILILNGAVRPSSGAVES